MLKGFVDGAVEMGKFAWSLLGTNRTRVGREASNAFAGEREDRKGVGHHKRGNLFPSEQGVQSNGAGKNYNSGRPKEKG